MKKPLSFLFVLVLAFGGAVEGVSTASAQNRSGNGFFNNLFNGGQRARDRRAAQAANSAQRQLNRQIQEALNFFNFDAGVADGILGARSRAAVSDYQGFLSLPVTGQLLPDEKEFLLESHTRATSGDADTNWDILANSNGAQGVLLSYLQEQQTGIGVATPPEPVLQPSMRAFCANIGVSQNLDHVKAQFCNLRMLAIEEGSSLLASSPQDISYDAMFEQCEIFSAGMFTFVERLVRRDAIELQAELSQWVASTGLPAQSLTRIAKICLAAGYQSDNSDIAIASSLALSGLDQAAYVELTGYHLAFGLGVYGGEQLARAVEWLSIAGAGYAGGSMPLTGQESRERTQIVEVLSGYLDEID